MAEKVILEVDVTGVTQSLLDARATLQGYKLALEDAIATNGKYSKEAEIAKAMVDSQNKSVKQLEGQLTRIVQVQEATNESLQDLMKNGYEPANKTVDQNRKVLNALTAEYNKASKEQREKLAQAIKSVSDELKKQEGAIGDTRRNVGNYTESLMQAFSGLQGFGGQIVQVGQSIGAGVNAFKAAEGGVRGFGAALGATGLPIFITAMNFLIEAFTTFKPIADAVEQIMGGLSFAMGSGYEAGVKLTQAIQDLEDAQRDAIVTNALYTKSINELEAQAANKAAKDEDRINALTKANKIRLEQLSEEKKIAQEQLRIANEEVKNSEARSRQIAASLYGLTFGLVRTSGEASDEVLEKQKKAQAAIIQLDDQFNQATIANQNKIDLLEKQLSEDKKRRQEESIKRKQDQLQKERDIEQQRELSILKSFENERNVRAAEIELLEDSLFKRLMLFDLQFEKEEEQLRKAGATEALITELRNKKVAEIEAQYSQKKQQQDEAFITNRQAMYDKAQQDMIDAADEAAKQVAQRDTQTFSNILNNIASIFGQAASYIEQFAQQNTEALERQYEQGLITEQQFNSQTKELKLKAFKEAKALKVTEAIIGTATATLNAFNSGLQLGGPLGMVIGAVFAAAAATLGATQIALISRQQPPKYAEGGQVFNVGGKSHAEGGTLYRGSDGNTFEVERGEKIFVMKANASRHIDALGGLNMAFGGRSWSDSPIRYAADGGMIQDGGFAIRQTSERASDMAMLKQFAKSIAEEIPTPVVSVTEINKVNKSRNRSIKTSEL